VNGHVVGQGLIGVASALFVAGAVGMVVGVVGIGAVTPLGLAALACLVAGGALVRRG
jgi:hypothetical protein